MPDHELLIVSVGGSVEEGVDLEHLLHLGDAADGRWEGFLTCNVFVEHFLELFVIFNDACGQIIGLEFALVYLEFTISLFELLHRLFVPLQLESLLFLLFGPGFHMAEKLCFGRWVN